ncbi:class I SAM-dependent methyltransferase [Singulisphaera sp. Ch08]|uniref:Class I SAM-dependent methyltransferase n=1 Tax=Singulisphaera sp. Ch08 TaxID=3120278 RepID=A0AAU7CLJ8_9BACT
MGRVQFVLPVVLKRLSGQDQNCPHCGASETVRVGTKYLIVQLRKCTQCELLFRWPKDFAEDNRKFYSGLYREDNGVTTNLPSPVELAEMRQTKFAGTDRDATERLALLKQLKSSGRLLDYGASWGYTTWQFAQAGYDVVGFEIDQDRAAYGRDNLGVPMIVEPAELAKLPEGSFDLIYTSHVLEHLPDLRQTFDLFHHLLRPGGVLAIYVPNATGIDRPEIFGRKKIFGFGEKHTMAFTVEFFERNLEAHGFTKVRVDTTPLAPLDQPRPLTKDLIGPLTDELLGSMELVAIAYKPDH